MTSAPGSELLPQEVIFPGRGSLPTSHYSQTCSDDSQSWEHKPYFFSYFFLQAEDAESENAA